MNSAPRPWKWIDSEESWVRLAPNHAPLARIRPPGPERKMASCSVYAVSGTIGRTSPDVHSAAEWCDGQLLRLGYKLRLSPSPILDLEVHKGMRWMWLRIWVSMERT